MNTLQQIYLIVLLGSGAVAFLKGQWPEQLAAAVIVCGSFLSPLVQLDSPYGEAEIGVFVVDLVSLVLLLAVALTSDRFWPLWATAFHLVATTTHLARMLDSAILPPAYAAAQVFWAYPMLLALVVGALWEASPSRATEPLDLSR